MPRIKWCVGLQTLLGFECIISAKEYWRSQRPVDGSRYECS